MSHGEWNDPRKEDELMYALRDKEHPDSTAMTDYYLTYEAAEAARSGRQMFSIHNPAGRDVPIPGEEFLEIVEVERESRPCRYCGQEIQSTNPEVDFCRGCFYSGHSQEDSAEPALELLRTIPGINGASVWHTGGGCFALGVLFPDDSYLLVADGDACVTDEDGKPLDPHERTWAAGYYWDEEDSEGIELIPESGWATSTIPEIVRAATKLITDPNRWETIAQHCDFRADEAAKQGHDHSADYYRTQAASLRQKGAPMSTTHYDFPLVQVPGYVRGLISWEDTYKEAFPDGIPCLVREGSTDYPEPLMTEYVARKVTALLKGPYGEDLFSWHREFLVEFIPAEHGGPAAEIAGPQPEHGLYAVGTGMIWESVVEKEATHTVLVHLNIEVPASDKRTATQIAESVMGAIEVGSDNDSVRNLSIALALTEDI